MPRKTKSARRPKSIRTSTVSRAEFEKLRETISDCCRTLEVQFNRFAQIQRELDELRSAWLKAGRRS